jgi:RNA polymerase sigma factor (sigma-70 family)
MVKVLARLDSEPFADEAHVLRWMTAVARNDIRDHVAKRRERAFESLSETWSSHARVDSRTPSPLSEAERCDHLLRLVECMERLSDVERTVVELHALEGLTFAAIGARLGWSDDRARLAHLRAMARLGQMIGDDGR